LDTAVRPFLHESSSVSSPRDTQKQVSKWGSNSRFAAVTLNTIWRLTLIKQIIRWVFLLYKYTEERHVGRLIRSPHIFKSQVYTKALWVSEIQKTNGILENSVTVELATIYRSRLGHN
jgi:hypothetical protein